MRWLLDSAKDKGPSSPQGPFARRAYEQDSCCRGRQWPAHAARPHIGEAHENRLCPDLLAGLQPQSMLLADREYDADWIRTLVNQQGA